MTLLFGCGRVGFDGTSPDAAPPREPVSFRAQSVPPSFYRNVWGTSATNVYAIGESSTILRSHGDEVWVPEPFGGAVSLYGIHGSSASDVWIVGNTTGGASAVTRGVRN